MRPVASRPRALFLSLPLPRSLGRAVLLVFNLLVFTFLGHEIFRDSVASDSRREFVIDQTNATIYIHSFSTFGESLDALFKLLTTVNCAGPVPPPTRRLPTVPPSPCPNPLAPQSPMSCFPMCAALQRHACYLPRPPHSPTAHSTDRTAGLPSFSSPTSSSASSSSPTSSSPSCTSTIGLLALRTHRPLAPRPLAHTLRWHCRSEFTLERTVIRLRRRHRALQLAFRALSGHLNLDADAVYHMNYSVDINSHTWYASYTVCRVRMGGPRY